MVANNPQSLFGARLSQFDSGFSRLPNSFSSTTTTGSVGDISSSLRSSSGASSLVRFDRNNDGVVQDEEAIHYILARLRMNREVDEAIFNVNENARSFKRIFDTFDRDNNNRFNTDEVIRGLLSINSGSMAGVTTEQARTVFRTIGDLGSVEEALDAADVNTDGNISDVEVYEIAVRQRAGDAIVSASSQDELETVLELNPNLDSIRAFVDEFDSSGLNLADSEDMVDFMLQVRTGALTDPGNDVIAHIFDANPMNESVVAIVNQIDADADGLVEDQELFNGLLSVRRSEFSASELGVVQYLLLKNSNHADMLALLDHYDRNTDGSVGDIEFLEASLQMRRGEFTTSLDGSWVDRVKELNTNHIQLDELIDGIDPDADGNVSDEELRTAVLSIRAGNLIDLGDVVMSGQFGARYTDLNTAAALLDTAPVDEVITNRELADALLRNNSSNTFASISDTQFLDLMRDLNANNSDIETLIAALDTDSTGTLSDAEVLRAMQQMTIDGTIEHQYETLVRSLITDYAENPDVAVMQTIYEMVDSDNFDARDGTISDTELARALLKYKTAGFSDVYDQITEVELDERGIEILDELLSTNSNFAAMQTAFGELVANSEESVAMLLNNLIDARDEGASSPYHILTGPLSSLISNWEASRDAAISGRLGEILSGVSSVSAVSGNTEQTNASQAITDEEDIIAAQTLLIDGYETDLDDPSITTMRVTRGSGKDERTVTVVNQAEVNRLNANIGIAQGEIDQARLDLTDARSVALDSLGIDAASQADIEGFFSSLDTLVLSLYAGNKDANYNVLEGLLTDSEETFAGLPQNFADILGKTIYRDFSEDLTLINTFYTPEDDTPDLPIDPTPPAPPPPGQTLEQLIATRPLPPTINLANEQSFATDRITEFNSPPSEPTITGALNAFWRDSEQFWQDEQTYPDPSTINADQVNSIYLDIARAEMSVQYYVLRLDDVNAYAQLDEITRLKEQLRLLKPTEPPPPPPPPPEPPPEAEPVEP